VQEGLVTDIRATLQFSPGRLLEIKARYTLAIMNVAKIWRE
jgi:hypothetical protein